MASLSAHLDTRVAAASVLNTVPTCPHAPMGLPGDAACCLHCVLVLCICGSWLVLCLCIFIVVSYLLCLFDLVCFYRLLISYLCFGCRKWFSFYNKLLLTMRSVCRRCRWCRGCPMDLGCYGETMQKTGCFSCNLSLAMNWRLNS